MVREALDSAHAVQCGPRSTARGRSCRGIEGRGVSGPVESRGRNVLVYACPLVLAEARPILGDACLENLVASLIVGGRLTRRPIAGVELRRGERFVRPKDRPWVAVVRRGPGRIVHSRTRSCWHVVRIFVAPGDAS